MWRCTVKGMASRHGETTFEEIANKINVTIKVLRILVIFSVIFGKLNWPQTCHQDVKSAVQEWADQRTPHLIHPMAISRGRYRYSTRGTSYTATRCSSQLDRVRRLGVKPFGKYSGEVI